MRFMQKYDPMGVPVDVINLEDYGNADGERIRNVPFNY